MSALNTFFNGQTARNTAATARFTGQMADAGRRWELQQRGWITPASTPGEVAAVEAILAAQMRARIELQSGRPWPFTKVAAFGGVSAGLLLLVSIGAAVSPTSRPGEVVVPLVLLLVVAATSVIAVLVIRGNEKWRAEVLARAVVWNGVCQWCRQPAPHILEGQQTGPRVYHAIDIERAINPGPR